MATIAVTKADDQVHARTLSWLALANGDDGAGIELPDHADRSVQVQGTFGAGGTVLIEGSNDGTNYVTLNDPQGNALSFTAAALKQALELSRFIRPRVSAGDGTTSLNIYIHARANR